MMNIEYKEVPSEYTFSTEFPTYIIAFCPDTDEFYVTNQRFWFYEYDKEFDTYEAGKEYFLNHKEEFLKIRKEMKDAIPFYEKNENDLWFAEEGKQTINVMKI